MDNTPAVTVSDVSKVYHVYADPKERLKELLSLSQKKYYREFWALDGVSLEVGKGESFGIIGRNGSGKTTLLKVICGILKPTAGLVKTRGRISALLELGTGFNPEFTGRENVYLNGALMGFSREETEARYQGITEFADIGDFINQPVKTYSSGMYVRLAFACAVNVDPDILVVDEALSVGDVFFQQKCYRKMSEFMEQGKTMILVSHSMDAIQRNCGRAVFLNKGMVVKIGGSKEVINHYLETMSTRNEPADASNKERERLIEENPGGFKVQTTVEDCCKSKPNYNKNEFRYGNGKANIVDFTMLDGRGKEVLSVSSGEPLRFRFEVAFNEPVESPVYGILVKTLKGVIVYGTNTWYEGINVEPGRPSDRVVVEFTQNVNLIAGDYFMSAGVSELTKDDVVAVDRRWDLAYLKVLPVGRAFGVANLFSGIEITAGGLRDGKVK